MGQIIYREYIVFGGSNISCSLATAIPYLSASLVVVGIFYDRTVPVEPYPTKH